MRPEGVECSVARCEVVECIHSSYCGMFRHLDSDVSSISSHASQTSLICVSNRRVTPDYKILLSDAALPRIPPAQMGIGSDRAEEMLDDRRDNFVWAVRRVPRGHERAIGPSGSGRARSFWV